MKKITTENQVFSSIIENNELYVDKTNYIVSLLPHHAVFLARPRRFGKSLFLDTLKEFFLGNSDLFAGLKIMDSGSQFKKYPVIVLDMTLDCYDKEMFITSVIEMLIGIADEENLKLTNTTPGGALEELVKKVSKKYNRKVVVLIDEYDRPVNLQLHNTNLFGQINIVLSMFYGSFKKIQSYLAFVFVTGVTRYAMMGLSSGLNNLTDISFNPEYSAICGFTVRELDQYFGDRYLQTLESLKLSGKISPESQVGDLRHKIIDWYDGYSWDTKCRVLNPISIIKFFEEQRFGDFWINTAPSVRLLSSTL
ncbi:MAG: AAA family ATPase [Deltaproteobacteria bacterium]|jgi:hypothetical protein|nr:AAA family ATPase [Deltaproteobacteria bacterium]